MTPSARRTLLEGVLLTLEGSGEGVSNAVALGRALLAGEDRAQIARAPRASSMEIAEVRDKVRAELEEFRVKFGMGVHPDVPWNPQKHPRGPGGEFSPGQTVMTSRGPAEVVGREFDMLRVKHRDGSVGLHPISAVRHRMKMAEAELVESKLSSAERDALPKSAFVFPEERRYPIHDIGHARNALARCSGKPEEGKVKAAVFKRYPGLKKEISEAAESLSATDLVEAFNFTPAERKEFAKLAVQHRMRDRNGRFGHDLRAPHVGPMMRAVQHTVDEHQGFLYGNEGGYSAQFGGSHQAHITTYPHFDGTAHYEVSGGTPASDPFGTYDPPKPRRYDKPEEAVAAFHRQVRKQAKAAKADPNVKDGEGMTAAAPFEGVDHGKWYANLMMPDGNFHGSRYGGTDGVERTYKTEAEAQKAQRALEKLRERDRQRRLREAPGHKKMQEAEMRGDYPSMMHVCADCAAKGKKKCSHLREAKDSMRKASTPEPFSTSKTSNWVARSGGLPAYIQHIAHDIHEKRGKSVSQAIQIAIGVVKRWAKGVGNVDANTRAAAAKAVAEWEALKAKNAGKKAAKTAKSLAEAAYFEPIIALESTAEALVESLDDPELLAECESLLLEFDAQKHLRGRAGEFRNMPKTAKSLLNWSGGAVVPLHGQETKRAAAQYLADRGLGEYDSAKDVFRKKPKG